MPIPKSKRKPVEEVGGDRLKRQLLEDDTFMKYRRIVKSIRESVDLSLINTEAMSLHASRKSRNLVGTTPTSVKLTAASAMDTANRSRLVEIRAKLTKQAGLLEVSLEAVRIHLRQEYSDQLEHLRTKGERMESINVYLISGMRLHSELVTQIEVLDMLVKDIDQAYWHLKMAAELLQLTTGVAAKERIV